MKDYDIMDDKLIEELSEKNYDHLSKKDNGVYYFDELIFVADMLNNAFELFGEPAAAEKVSAIGNKMLEDKTIIGMKVFDNPSNALHVPSQSHMIKHYKIPDGDANRFLSGVSKALAYIEVLEKKFPDEKSIERRVLNIIKNYAKTVTEHDNYLDVLALDPLYANVINSAFATFPVPMFSKGKINGQHVYEYDRDKYIKLMKDMRLIEFVEEKQKFFMEQAIPYADAFRKGTLSDTQAANYYFKYKEHMEKLRELNKGLFLANIVNKDIEKCKTIITNNYKINFVDRFYTPVDKMIRKNDRFMDKGWPVADLPLLIEITNWYEKVEGMTDPASRTYVERMAKEAKDILSDITPVYRKLTETTITNSKVRKKLLKEFNALYRKYEKIITSNNGLTSEYIEKRSEHVYKDNEFRMMAKKTEDEKVNKFFGDVRNLYYLQKSNVNKLDVIVHLAGIHPCIAEYRMREDYNSIDKLNEIGIYNNRELGNVVGELEAMMNDFLGAYTDDIDGYRQILKDIGTLRARIALEFGKERKRYYDSVSENDPDRERKIDYITANAGGTDQRLRSVNDTFSSLYGSVKRKQPYALVMEIMKNKGMSIEDATIGEIIEICGLKPSEGIKFFADTLGGQVLPDDNFVEKVRKSKGMPVKGKLDEREADDLISGLDGLLRDGFTAAMLQEAFDEFRETLSGDETDDFAKGVKLCNSNYTLGLNKSDVPERNVQYKEWVVKEGKAIAESYKKSNSFDNIKREFNYLNLGAKESFRELDFSENADNLNNYYNLLEDNTHWYKGGSSRNFDKMMGAFKRLKDCGDKLAKLNRKPDEKELMDYLALAVETENLAQFYLVNKKSVNSDYARKRVQLVTDIHNKLVENIRLFNDSQMSEMAGKANRDNSRLNESADLFSSNKRITKKLIDMYARGANFRAIYQGDNYNDDMLGKLPKGSYSLERNAPYAIAMMVLCAEADDNGNRLYTFDDIMDNDKLQAEKRRIFDTVVRKISESADKDKKVSGEAQKWIASAIYKGQKASIDMMDEEMAGISFTDSNVIGSDKFCKIMALSAAQFDVWQEMKHCNNEIMELVKPDHPDIRSYEGYKEYITTLNGPVSNVYLAVNKLAGEYDRLMQGEEPDYGNIVKDNLQIQLAFNMFKEWEKAKGGKTFSKWALDNNLMEKYSNILTAGMNISFPMAEMTDNEMKKWMLESIADGSMFANLRYIGADEPKKNAGNEAEGDTSDLSLEEGRYEYMASPLFSGIPSYVELAKEWKVITGDKNKLKEQLEKTAAKLDKYIEKADGDRVVIPYIKQAKTAAADIYDIINDNKPLTGAAREKAKDAVRKIMSFRFLREFEKAGIKGRDLKTAVKAAVTSVPELDKNMEYLSKAFLAELAFTDKGKEIAKASPDRMFAGKAAIALNNLERKNYRGKDSEFVRDAAYAFTAQQLRVKGELKDDKTGIVVPAAKYADKLAKSSTFKESLKTGEPKKYMPGPSVAKMAGNDKAYRNRIAEEAQKENMKKIKEEFKNTLNSKADRKSVNPQRNMSEASAENQGKKGRSASVNHH